MTRRSGSELKRLAREFLLGNCSAVMAAMLTASFLPAVLLLPFSTELTTGLNVAVVTYLIAAIILKLLGQLLSAGVLRMHLLLAQEQRPAFRDLFWTFRNRPDRFLLAATLLFIILLFPVALAGVCIYCFLPDGAMEQAIFAAGGASVLVFCVPYLTYSLEMIYPLYIEHPDMTVVEGFRASEKLMKGNKKRFFVLQLGFLGWQLLGVCSAGAGFLWISPYIRQTTANFYLDLTGGLDKKGIHIDASVDDRF